MWPALQAAPYPATESLLHQPALGDPAGVGRGQAVLDIQLLAGVLKDIIADTPKIAQEFPPAIYIHQHAAAVTFILQRL